MSPYFPFTGEPYALIMGVKPLDPAQWIEPDLRLADDLAAKRSILEQSSGLALATSTDLERDAAHAFAAAELLESLIAHLVQHHPEHYAPESMGIRIRATGARIDLPALHSQTTTAQLLRSTAALIQEDVCLLSPAPRAQLAAGVVCFPSRWNIAEKVGLDASAIHAPVPGFTASLAQPTTHFLDRITPERSFWRLNWTIHDSDLRFAPHPVPGRTDLTPEDVLSSTFLRIERQTLRRLPRSGFVAFTIRTYIDRLDGVVAAADRCERLRRTLTSMPDDAIAYKGMATFIRPLLQALAQPPAQP